MAQKIIRGILMGCLCFVSGRAAIAQSADVQTEATTAPAASTDAPRLLATIVTLDPDKLFNQSAYGVALIAELAARKDSLAAENRAIEADLTKEEQDLAQRRPTMDPAAFRTAAADFDTKVQEIRQAQDAKERELQQWVSDSRDLFFTSARPFLGEVMLAHGAALILDRRSVFLSLEAIDITDEVLAIVDERLQADFAELADTTTGN